MNTGYSEFIWVTRVFFYEKRVVEPAQRGFQTCQGFDGVVLRYAVAFFVVDFCFIKIVAALQLFCGEKQWIKGSVKTKVVILPQIPHLLPFDFSQGHVFQCVDNRCCLQAWTLEAV